VIREESDWEVLLSKDSSRSWEEENVTGKCGLAGDHYEVQVESDREVLLLAFRHLRGPGKGCDWDCQYKWVRRRRSAMESDREVLHLVGTMCASRVDSWL